MAILFLFSVYSMFYFTFLCFIILNLCVPQIKHSLFSSPLNSFIENENFNIEFLFSKPFQGQRHKHSFKLLILYEGEK